MVTDDPIFVKEPIYLNIFVCGKNLLNRIDATCEQACMATSRDKYYTELYRTITDWNDQNGASLYNENILDAICRVIVEEEVEAHNVTVDTFSQTPVTPNTQVTNEKTILTSEKRNNLEALAETLKGLTIKDTGSCKSDSENANDVNGGPAIYPNVANHTTSGKKRKFMDTSNEYLQQKLLSNRTLLIIAMIIDPHIDNMVATYRASTINIVTPCTT